MKGQERCKFNSKLNSKHSKLFGDPNWKTDHLILSINSILNKEGHDNAEFIVNNCDGLGPYDHNTNPKQLTPNKAHTSKPGPSNQHVADPTSTTS